MKTKFLIFVLVAVLMSTSALAAACPITSSHNIAIYGQTGTGGVGTPSKSWMTHFFDWWKTYDPSVNYIFLTSTNVKSDCTLTNYPNLQLYVQPGGDAYLQQKALSSGGKTKILNFIDSGKAFLGTCAGWYYASNDYYWQGSFYNHANLLDRFPTLEGSITSIADYDVPPGFAMTALSNGHNMIYYGGPTRGWQNTPATHPGTALASFASIPGNLPAAVKNGKMLLTSVHAEAYENDGISGLSTAQRIENYKWLANAINDAAGTNFSVPAYTQCHDGLDNDADNLTDYPFDPGCSSIEDNDETNPMCSDGLDNDADNLTDYPQDPGCTSAADNDEVDQSGPADVFVDDFESGSLSGWTLTTAGGANPWAASTVNPAQGTYHAQAQPSSTSEPASVLERSISTSGYQNINFSYQRRLVGIDAADEFKAKWFDGSSWNIVEETTSSSANDAGYVSKVFVLPSSAGDNSNFKIRFECTAGAVSEYCRVDNVKVTSG